MKNLFLVGLAVMAMTFSGSTGGLSANKKGTSSPTPSPVLAPVPMHDPALYSPVFSNFKDKAPKALPSKRPHFADTIGAGPSAQGIPLEKDAAEDKKATSEDEQAKNIRTKQTAETTGASTQSSVDTTPPSAPSFVNATAHSLSSIEANWGVSQDTESGVAKYVYAIGTYSSGTQAQLGNIQWWRVLFDTHVSVNISLDPNVTYYVSVYAINGAGLRSPTVTSGPIDPEWIQLGQAKNAITLQFAPTGIDASGNPTSGWTPAQIATMTSFFEKMYPIVREMYGPPASNYTVTVVRDLRYASSNIFLPSTDEIRKDDTFNPQLFTHELVHAFRNDYILSSDQNWSYNSTLSGFEESFAQAVSYDAMNRYVELYPKDALVPSNSLWGSLNDWDYDYQNTPELRGTDFWSDGGGTNLYFRRYEMGAVAMRKIQLESPGFYKRFNQEYYQRINQNPTTVRSTRPLIVDIIATLVPTIEAVPAREWIDKQHIFYAQNVYGQKIFHDIQDYPSVEFFVLHRMFFMNTMSCGSEWACYVGQQWAYHNLNGSQGEATLKDIDGRTVWSGNLLIEPTTNPAQGNFVFGFDTKGFTTATSTATWPGGDPDDYIVNLRPFGLYKFTSSFTNPYNGQKTTNTLYRVMGAELAQNYGIWGGILNHRNGTIYIDHEGFPKEPGIPVVNGAFVGSRAWAGVPNPRTGGFDTVPGKVFITFVDSNTNQTFHAQRNIDYGSSYGNQMFLFDFPISQGGYGTPGSRGTTNPLPNDQ